MKIVAEESLRGKKFILPELGETTIPEDGVLELSDDVATLLVISDIGYSFVGKTKKEVIEPTDETKEEVTENQFDSMSLEELIEVAEQAGLPDSEWRKFADNKKDPKMLMVKYLTKKTK